MYCRIVEITNVVDNNNAFGWVLPPQYENTINASGHVVPAIFTHQVKVGSVHSMLIVNKNIDGTLFRFQTDPKAKKPIFEQKEPNAYNKL